LEKSSKAMMTASKRWTLAFVALLVLASSALLCSPVLADDVTPKCQDFRDLHVNKKDTLPKLAFAALSDKATDGMWTAILRNDMGDLGIYPLKDLRDGDDINAKARLFMLSGDTLVVFYYNKNNDLIGKKIQVEATATVEDPHFSLREDKFMDERSTPLWDIVYSKDKGFYLPYNCWAIDDDAETLMDHNACKLDCFTIDTYCVYDPTLTSKHQPLIYNESKANLKGGPRSFKNQFYNSLQCNGFREVPDNDGQRAFQAVNYNEPEVAVCYRDVEQGLYQLQVFNPEWTSMNTSNCITLDGRDLGFPKMPARPDETTTSGSTPAAQVGTSQVCRLLVTMSYVFIAVAVFMFVVTLLFFLFIFLCRRHVKAHGLVMFSKKIEEED